MKFRCTKENLSKALSLVGALASKHNNLPILMNVMIKASESSVELVATNLEVAARATIRAKVEKTGSFTVPAKMLSDYISLLRGGQVDITQQENEVLVECGNAKTKMKGAPADEFPVMPEADETHGYSIDVLGLKEALMKTVIATAKNEIRPELAGVYFGFFTDRHKGLVLAATDSYRLAEKKVSVSQGEDETTCIVPARTVYEMIRLLTNPKDGAGETQARLWVGASQIGLRCNEVELTSRLVDGTYPDYTQIIPTEFKTKAAAPADVLIQNIKAASLFSTTGINGVSFDLNAQENTVGISSTSSQTGEHSATIEAAVEGEENTTLLNFRYVLEGLQQISGEVGFQMNSGDAPCLFSSKTDDSYIYIVMPIRQ